MEEIKQTLNKIFNNFNRLEDNNGYILRSKNKPEYDIGLSGSKYFYLLDVLFHEKKRLYYIRNPYAHSHFRGVHDKMPEHLEKSILSKRK
jgi:hypothetical protein